MLNTMTEAKTEASSNWIETLGSLRFDWMATFFSMWIGGGLYLDGWAHDHGKVDNTFFTPWHAILYGGVFLMFAFLATNQLRNMRRGYPWPAALPAGYQLSLLGAFLFLIGGGLDLAWHSLFGFEVDLETLLSPSHLLLATSGVLMISGPVRAAWQQERLRQSENRQVFWPMVLSLTLVLSILTFFTQFAHPYRTTFAANTGQASQAAWQSQSMGVASVLLQSALLLGVLLLAVRHGRLPLGALTAIIFLSNSLMTVLHDHYELIPAALFAGLFAELLYRWLKPDTSQPRFALFAFSVPVVVYGLNYLAVQVTQGIGWTIHLWLGSLFLAGIMGLFVSFLLVSPLHAAE